VASCVVFTNEGPMNKEYRRFNIKNITPGDDYAAMHQVMARRYTRIKEENKTLPDLIMIDGGKGQLQQGCLVLEELQISGVQLLAVAKGVARKPGQEQLFLQNRTQPVLLSPNSSALHLIQFVRDEAHRFAITAHRAKRNKKATHSPLENIEGIGAKRRRDLLQHFGGLRELEKAGVADIAKVTGISEELAKRIYDALH
jgi:excinuclease ABC subunit C